MDAVGTLVSMTNGQPQQNSPRQNAPQGTPQHDAAQQNAAQQDAGFSDFYREVGEETFAKMVAGFYRRVPEDDILGPMYPDDDWEGAEASPALAVPRPARGFLRSLRRES